MGILKENNGENQYLAFLNSINIEIIRKTIHSLKKSQALKQFTEFISGFYYLSAGNFYQN
jgi:hypothetical protein